MALEGWNGRTAGQTDADSPLDATLMDGLRKDLDHLRQVLYGSTDPSFHTPIWGHDHDGANSETIDLTGLVARTDLKTTMSSVSTGGASSLLTLPGGEYGFYPQTKISSVAGTQNAHMVNSIAIGTSYVSYITLGTSAGTISAQQRYIQASPPYMIGNKQWGHFLFLLRRISDGVVVSSYEAEDPCWAYNGNPSNAKDSPERIAEVPHPFGDYTQKDPAVDGLEIVLVDLSTVPVKKWIGDNRKVGKGILEDVGAVLTGRGTNKAHSDYSIPAIPNFTDRVKIITP